MQLSDIPALIRAAFAGSGTKRTIPLDSQAGVTPGAASFAEGFPPLTMTAISAGGIPPAGADFNGILNAITLFQRWQSGGGPVPFNTDWSTRNGGYPKGALISRVDGTGFWFSLVDSNTTDPDSSGAANWVPGFQSGLAALSGLTGGTVTATPLQYGRPVLVLTGSLTSNLQLNLPPFAGVQWLVVNNTTGAFGTTIKTPSGSGVLLPSGQAQAVWGDGTNILTTLPPGRLINAQRFISSGTYTPTAGTRMVRVTAVGGGGAGGGGFATSGTSYAVGSGGGSAGSATGLFMSGFSGQAVVIGAGGTPSSGAAGGAGGASSFGGTLVQAPGGGGGGTSTAATNNNSVANQGNAGAVGTVTGGTALAVTGGQPGAVGLTFANFGPISGQGGASPLGAGGGNNTAGGAGTPGTTPGAGGGGAASPINAANTLGGAGANGLVLIEEFA